MRLIVPKKHVLELLYVLLLKLSCQSQVYHENNAIHTSLSISHSQVYFFNIEF